MSRHTVRRIARIALMRLETRSTPAVFTVANTNDSGPGSLRDALALCSSPGSDTIFFDPLFFATPQTIKLTTGELFVDVSDSIDVFGPTGGLTISGENKSRILQINDGSVSLLNMTLTGGNATGDGGAILAGGSGTIFLDHAKVTGNTCTGRGGGISSSADLLSIG